MYNAREHPKYKNGEMTEKEVFQEFLKNFEPDNADKDGKVSENLRGAFKAKNTLQFMYL